MALGRFCLDTSAYARFRRGDQGVVEMLDRADWVGIPSIVLGELRAGFRGGSRATENEAELLDFLTHPAVESIDLGADASHHYADIILDLRRAGTPVPTNDIWIASAAAAVGAIVVTYDDHFKAISRVGSVVLGQS